MRRSGFSGFTFVELIVATAIIAILASIGFSAYINQLGNSRDGRRIAEMQEINDALTTLSAKGAKYPLPMNSIQITTTNAVQTTSSVQLIGFQGEFGSDLLKQIGFSNGGMDPKDKYPYIYYVARDRRRAELMGYMEDGSNAVGLNELIFPSAYAGLSDYSTRYPKFIGKPLGIVTENATKRSIHDVSTLQAQGYFNIMTTGANYTVNYTDKDKLTGASANLVNSLRNKSCKRLRDVGAANGDGTYKINPTGASEIEVYCDMTTDGGGWTFFGHINDHSPGNGFFDAALGSYKLDRRDDGTTYNFPISGLGFTEMMVTLDTPNPVIAQQSSKLVFFSYPLNYAGFNSGPVACSGLTISGFSYKLLPGSSYIVSSQTPSCSSSSWYPKNIANAYLALFTTSSNGNYWGSGMGGNNSWYHDGWWYAR